MSSRHDDLSKVEAGSNLAQVELPPGYPDQVAYSAHDVAADIRRRLPGVPTTKLHKLLYYAQGHHLATFGRPLFTETISAWDMGPVVTQLWRAEDRQVATEPPHELAEAELNTVGYVVSRYGRLSGADLVRLTHNEAPWRDADDARRAADSRTQRIEVAAMRAFFMSESDDDDVPSLDPLVVRGWLKDAQPTTDPAPDDTESLLARLQ